MRVALSFVLFVHGLIHLLGAAKGLGFAKVEALAMPMGRAEGALWLLAAIGFLISAVLVHAAPTSWWLAACPALVLSQGLIVRFWADAKFGTLANVIVAIPALLAMLEARPGSFRSMYEKERDRHLARLAKSAALVTEHDLADLPPLVQTYVRRAGAIGRPRVLGFRAQFHGRFRQGLDRPWMDFTSEQHNFLEPSARLFLMSASLFGIPMVGYHDFVGPEARFRVRVLSLAQVVDGHGPRLNQSETVTIFNDLCVLAPAALVGLPVRWATLDAHSVRAVFTRGDQTIASVLVFDTDGDLVDFISEDRYFSADGIGGEKLPWLTPIRGHREFGAARLPERGDATWRMATGDFVYGEFHLDEVEYFPAAAPR